MKILKTDRLFLRNLEPSDIDMIFDYRNNEECFKFQRWDDCSKEAIEGYILKFGQDEFLSTKEEQHFAICRLVDQALVGELAYFYTEKDNCITLGITISYQHHKKGYAFEILTEVIHQIKEQYPTMDIVGLIEKGNVKSQKLFEKLGFVQECYAESIESYIYVIYGN